MNSFTQQDYKTTELLVATNCFCNGKDRFSMNSRTGEWDSEDNNLEEWNQPQNPKQA